MILNMLKLNKINFFMKKMRSWTLLMAVVSIIACLYSCGSNPVSDDKFGKISVEIPKELKDKPEVVEYIKSVEETVDEYALLFDDILEDVGEYAGVEESELSTMDRMKLINATSKVALRSTEIMAKWGECTNKRMQMNETLSADEIIVLDKLWQQFEERMVAIKAKHEKVFAQE